MQLIFCLFVFFLCLFLRQGISFLLFGFVFVLLRQGVSLHSSGSPKSHSVAQARNSQIHLPLPYEEMYTAMSSLEKDALVVCKLELRGWTSPINNCNLKQVFTHT